MHPHIQLIIKNIQIFGVCCTPLGNGTGTQAVVHKCCIFLVEFSLEFRTYLSYLFVTNVFFFLTNIPSFKLINSFIRASTSKSSLPSSISAVLDIGHLCSQRCCSVKRLMVADSIKGQQATPPLAVYQSLYCHWLDSRCSCAVPSDLTCCWPQGSQHTNTHIQTRLHTQAKLHTHKLCIIIMIITELVIYQTNDFPFFNLIKSTLLQNN